MKRNGSTVPTIVRAARFIVNRFCSAFLRFLPAHHSSSGVASQNVRIWILGLKFSRSRLAQEGQLRDRACFRGFERTGFFLCVSQLLRAQLLLERRQIFLPSSIASQNRG